MTRRLRGTIALSGLGHVVHNVEEFGLAIAAVGQTAMPALVTVLLYLRARRPTGGFLGLAAIWGGVVIVVGGASVLPWPFLPFEPAQTVSHYLAHLVYVLLQIPMLAIAYREWRGHRHRRPSNQRPPRQFDHR